MLRVLLYPKFDIKLGTLGYMKCNELIGKKKKEKKKFSWSVLSGNVYLGQSLGGRSLQAIQPKPPHVHMTLDLIRLGLWT